MEEHWKYEEKMYQTQQEYIREQEQSHWGVHYSNIVEMKAWNCLLGIIVVNIVINT